MNATAKALNLELPTASTVLKDAGNVQKRLIAFLMAILISSLAAKRVTKQLDAVMKEMKSDQLT